MGNHKIWKCSRCGHIILAEEHPEPIYWNDGHICIFIKGDDKDI